MAARVWAGTVNAFAEAEGSMIGMDPPAGGSHVVTISLDPAGRCYA
jgi:hypothetical protein